MTSATRVDLWFVILAPHRGDLYWRPNSCGYTTSLAQAGVYPAEKAEGIVRLGRGDTALSLSSLRKDLQEGIREAKNDLVGLQEKLDLLK